MAEQPTIIIIDDELHVRTAASQALELEGHECCVFAHAAHALDRISLDWPGIVISDIRMPDIDGLQVLERVRSIDPELPVVLVTGHGDISTAVHAIKNGAYDFIEKPYARDHFLDVVARALEKRRLTLENRDLRLELSSLDGAGPRLVGRTPVMQRVRKRLLAIAQSQADVLVSGETGTGKEVAARFIHQTGARHDGPFVAVNCGALPAELIESELFGHEAGAFTGAGKRRIGKFEHSNGGTLFLDEIESMPLDMQVKILRVLQERSVERLGSNDPVALDLRIVAATKTDLKEAAAQGRFREDLYYRLNVATVELPPLRERSGDIPLLFQHFLLAAAARYNVEVPAVDATRHEALLSHSWPGNVRELRNAAERFLLFGEDDPDIDTAGGEESLGEKVARFERGLIVEAMQETAGSISQAARLLGLPRKTLTDKLQRYGLERRSFHT